jgi:predicted nuclease of predicted toxin-antitoxin system
VWEYAAREGITILTKDEDFAARRQREPQGPTIIWLGVGNRSRLRWYGG